MGLSAILESPGTALVTVVLIGAFIYGMFFLGRKGKNSGTGGTSNNSLRKNDSNQNSGGNKM
jgi:hypothetical protein